MKHEIIIELERVTIIEKQTQNYDSTDHENENVIEVEATEIKENRATPNNPKQGEQK